MSYNTELARKLRTQRDEYFDDSSGTLRYKANAEFNGDRDEWSTRNAYEDMLEDIYDTFTDYLSTNKSNFEDHMLKTLMAQFLEYYDATIGELTETQSSTGAVTLARDGLLGELYRQMLNAVTVDDDGQAQIAATRVQGRSVGVNTDQYGTLYARIFVGGGGYLIEFYSDASLTTSVAVASSVGSTSTNVAIVELNDSGISGVIGSFNFSASQSFTIITQTIKANTTTIGGASQAAENSGKVSFTSNSALQNCADNIYGSEIITVECDVATIGSERFTVQGRNDAAGYDAYLGTLFASIDLGAQFQMNRIIDWEDDTAVWSGVTNVAVTGLTATNTPNNKHYMVIASSSTAYSIKAYREAGHTNLVASALITASSGTVTMNVVGSGPTIVITYTAAPTSTGHSEIDYNAVAAGDNWSIALGNSWDGRIQSFFCRQYNFALPSRASDYSITEPSLL